MQKNKERVYFKLFIFTIVFGLIGGVAGGIISKVYIFDKIYPLPFFGNIDFSGNGYDGSGIVITGAKKVVVEQEARINEIIELSKKSIVGIYKKNDDKTNSLENNAKEDTENIYSFENEDYYLMSENLGDGLIITSDGWVISGVAFPVTDKKIITDDYIIITGKKIIFEIDDYIVDPLTGFSYLHAKEARDLNIMEFGSNSEILSGEMVVYNNFNKDVVVSSVIKIEREDNLIRSSDKYFDSLKLSNSDYFSSKGFVFDLKGRIIALVKNKDMIRPIGQFKGAMNGLLANKKIDRPKVGINYIDLNELALTENSTLSSEYFEKAIIAKNKNEVSVEKNSLAFKAGLKENDIILSINNIPLDKENNLTYLIGNNQKGDSILVEYLRNNEKGEVRIEL
jgi:hypothetical protein